MAPTLAALKAKRANSRGAITRVKAFIEGSKDRLPEEVQCRITLLDAYFKQYMAIQDQIYMCDEATDVDKASGAEVEDMYCETKAQLLVMLQHRKGDSAAGASDASMSGSSDAASTAVLPKIKLPSFAGDCIAFANFMKTFELAISQQPGLSNVAKFFHLRSCLAGEAFKTIEALSISGDNYHAVLKLLHDRYGNRYLVHQSHIRNICDVPAVAQLRVLVDQVNVNLKALESLSGRDDILNGVLIYLTKRKLDKTTRDKWEEIVDRKQIPTWDSFVEFLNNRCQFLQAKDALTEPRPSNRPKQHTRTSLTTASNSCPTCSSTAHNFATCPTVLSASVSKRFKEAKRLGLCINCLRKGHSVRSCPSRLCRVCSQRHHTILHRHVETNQPPDNALATPSTAALHSGASDADQVVLATAIALFDSKSGQQVPARVLLDSASQLNFMTTSLAQTLGLPRFPTTVQVSGIGTSRAQIKDKVNCTVKSRDNNFAAKLTAFVMPKITGNQPERDIRINEWPIPFNVQLADPSFNASQRVDAILRADLFYKVLCVGQIKLGRELPMLQKTLFGWVVAGTLASPSTSRLHSSLLAEAAEEDYSADDLHDQLEKFWKLEEPSSSAANLTDEQHFCETHFQQTTTQDASGRFIVRLPFKKGPPNLGESHSIAVKSLARLETKFDRNPELKEGYTAFIQEYQELGHMSSGFRPNPTIRYFIPHHCVLRPDSSSTKLRVVFNASSSTTTMTSLNEFLAVGPTIQDDLLTILIRFRCCRYAVSADIVKMYRQIRIHHEDQNYLAILWRDSPNKDMLVHLLFTIVYGTSSASYQAIRCLQELAKLCEHQYPIGARNVLKDFYVDNMLTGADTDEALHQAVDETEALLAEGCFELRK